MGPITITFAAMAMNAAGNVAATPTQADEPTSAPPPAPRAIIIPPPAPPPVQKPRPTGPNLAPTPRYGLTTVYGNWDYPEAAKRERRGGTTKIAVSVSKWGTVADCRIVSSSGHADLDAATCDRIANRARFWPATDAEGKDIAGTYEHTARWDPANAPPVVRSVPASSVRVISIGASKLYPVPPRPKKYSWARLAESDWPTGTRSAKATARVRTIFDIDAEGKVTACRVAESGGNPELDARSCAIVRERAEFVPARGLDGEPAASRGEQVFEWRGSEPIRAAPLANRTSYRDRAALLPAFMYRPGKASVRMVLDGDGKAEDCKVEGSGGLDGIDKMADRLCKDARAKGFRTASNDKAELPREIEATIEVKTKNRTQ